MADAGAIDIVDIKPINMEELTEVITAAEFHPIHCNQFMYSSSKGTIKLADMRDSALCDQHAKRKWHVPIWSPPSLTRLFFQNSKRRRTPQTGRFSKRLYTPNRT
jgi:hypothetical protein